MIAVARLSAFAVAVMAGFMTVSAMIALARREPGADVYLLTALLFIFGAGAVYLAVRQRPARLNRLSSYALLLVLWTGVPVLAAIPIATTTTLGPFEAWVEAVSAFTTSGAIQIHDVAKVPRATLAWLLTLQWCGGLLTLLGVVAVLAPAGIGGLPDHTSRASLHGHSEAATFDDALRQVLPIYFGATVLCTLLLFAAGVPMFDALGLAGAATSTGGLLPDPDGMAAYGHFVVKLVMMVFMLVGGTSVLWHRLLVMRRFRLAASQHENLAVLCLALMLGIVSAAIWFETPVGSQSLPLALEDGMFTAISLVTTMGVEPHAGTFATLPLTLVLVVIFIGGATFSTAGGIKMYRVGVMCLQGYRELDRLVHPNAVRPRRLGQQNISLQMMKAIWIAFGAACTTIVVVAAAIAPAMPSFEASFVAAVAALSNAGPVYAAGWSDTHVWPDWADLPAYARFILAGTMILGRLEILVLLGLVNFAFWRR